MAERLTIDERYRGFPTIALGGYACGLIGARLDGASEVRLHKPVQMGRPLELEARDGSAYLRDGDEVLGEGAPVELEIDVPEPPAYREAEAASGRYPGFHAHLYPDCFGCGPSRRRGDGLRMFPGKLQGRAVLATTWIPVDSFCDRDGHVLPELIWAAADCPQLWALHLAAQGGEEVLTGAMAARLVSPVSVEERHVVLSWPMERDGRKLYAGAAVVSESGDVRAVSRQTSILVDHGLALDPAIFEESSLTGPHSGTVNGT